MQQTLSFSCLEEAKSVSALAAQFDAGQLCASRALNFVYKPHKKHRKAMDFQTASLCSKAQREKEAISFQRIEKMLKRLKKNLKILWNIVVSD